MNLTDQQKKELENIWKAYMAKPEDVLTPEELLKLTKEKFIR